MDWTALFGAYGVLMTVVFGFGALLQSLLREEVQNPLGQWLGVQVEHAPVAWVRATNRAFLHLFDRLFGGRGTPLERGVWAGLLLSPVMLLALRILDIATGGTEQTTAVLLLYAMSQALSFALGISASLYLLRRGPIVRGIVMRILIVYGITFGIVVGIVVGIAMRILIVGGIVGGIVIGIVVGIVVGIGIGSVIGIVIGIVIVGVMVGVMVIVGGIGIVIGTVIVGFIGIGTVIVFGIVGVIGISTRQMPVHPLKALASSAIFILIVSLIKPDAARTFLEAIDADGLKMLAFVAFNVFADGVSLLETRWVLQRSVEASLRGLLGWLALDLILSAAIFLVLPAILWELPAFLEAARFRGERPWLGILFWTTFSTSAVFYVFVLASLLVRPLSRVAGIGQHFDVQDKPVLAITFAFAVATTVLFLGIAFIYWAMAQ